MAGKSAAEKAAEAAGVKVEEVRGDGCAAVVAAAMSGAAVAVAEAEAVGGVPAAGQGHAAVTVEGTAVQDVKVPDGADGLRRSPSADDRGTFPRPHEPRAALGLAFERPVSLGGAVTLRTGRDEILPLGAPTVDPTTVPGTKVATATAQVRRDKRSYVPGETFPVDYRAYTELVPIGAIEATPWHDLPDHDDD